LTCPSGYSRNQKGTKIGHVQERDNVVVFLDMLYAALTLSRRPIYAPDSLVDYLPTQYVSDYIKSKGFDSIDYISTMSPDGVNLAVFLYLDYFATEIPI